MSSGGTTLRGLDFPRALGRNYHWLWSAATVANLGDGILLAAGPLLAASMTREPFAVAMAVFAQRLPWMLFGVLAGAIVDRLDRRTLVMVADGLRVLVLGGLALAVALDAMDLPLLYMALFLVGTAESFADNAGNTLVTAVVSKGQLGMANARLFGASVVTNQLAGPPLGALLFGVGMALPFGANALCYALAVAMIFRLQGTRTDRSAVAGRSLRADIREGMSWLWAHKPVRTLAILVTVFNIAFGAAFAVWVLYAKEQLKLDDVGFGLLLTASALGGVLGSVIFGRLERRFSYGTLLRIGLTLETFTHLGLVLTDNPWVAGAVMFVFGTHEVVWATVSTTVRQKAVPEHLLGRVTSVYMLGAVGAMAIGTILGGVIAQVWGIQGPFWFGFAGSAVATVVVWRSMVHIASAAENPEQALS
ncbi:MFS transporter [Pseudarthrobacter sp. N5]|uniref:MFS transporter n=1 Tax=Pseudarthrobacter sp. N5 TaxID=3418416 RepID=UPI003CF488E2